MSSHCAGGVKGGAIEVNNLIILSRLKKKNVGTKKCSKSFFIKKRCRRKCAAGKYRRVYQGVMWATSGSQYLLGARNKLVFGGACDEVYMTGNTERLSHFVFCKIVENKTKKLTFIPLNFQTPISFPPHFVVNTE